MNILKILVLLVTFFLGMSFLVHICAKNKCSFKYTSTKRKIEICPKDKSQPTVR